MLARRALGAPVLFSIVYTSLASAIYFSLGVVVDRAQGLTPVVFLLVGLFFVLTAMTYAEGSSLHSERAGSTVFARFAFNELWSFVAGWAVLLDFLILVAVTSLSAVDYAAVFWGELGEGTVHVLLAMAIIAYVAVRNIRGFSPTRWQRVGVLVAGDLALQLLIIVVGLALLLDPGLLVGSIELGAQPRWEDLIFALTVGTVVFTGLESAAGLAGEVAVSRRGLKRMITSAAGVVLVLYAGTGLVAVSAFPPGGAEQVPHGAPVVAVVERFDGSWASAALGYVVAALATVTLVAAANSAMMGLSRLAYSLARNRQIPASVGRLHPTRATPYVVIGSAGVLAAALVVPRDLDLLIGIYAFGALLAFVIAHLAIIVLRYREPDRKRPYRIPLGVRVGGGELPLPAAVGAVTAALAFLSLLVFHEGARYVGLAWMLGGVGLYVVYRTTQGKPLFARVFVPELALRRSEPDEAAEYGSILVPIFGGPLDDDIVQTAGRLAAEDDPDAVDRVGATIEALWVFEVPMALPIDARLPEAQLERARAALRRAKAVGEEYEGVEVATATVRARRAGQAIVEEARRRGVEAIVLAAEEPSRIRGGARLGGIAAADGPVGDVTRYVIAKAPCRVILTAPPATEGRPGRDGDVGGGG